MKDSSARRDRSATGLFASATGVLVGLAGMDHGFFEVFQGPVAPSGRVIEAIGPAQRFWEFGAEPAFTLIPSFLITGILAMVVGLLVIVWAVAFIDRRLGPLVLALLSVALFLVGGGFAPLVLAVLPVAAATRIDKPLTWWRARLPLKVRGFLARFWAWPLIAFVFLSLFSIEIAIFGYPVLWFFSADGTLAFLTIMSDVAFFVIAPVAIVAAFAYDIESQTG